MTLNIGAATVMIAFPQFTGGTWALDLLEAFTEQRVRRTDQSKHGENPVDVSEPEENP